MTSTCLRLFWPVSWRAAKRPALPVLKIIAVARSARSQRRVTMRPRKPVPMLREEVTRALASAATPTR